MPVMPAAEMPPVTPSQERVMDLLMVTPPKPPGSRQLISPPAAVLEMAPANVLHGAVRLHGLTSSPTPETQVRVACALTGARVKNGAKQTIKTDSTIPRMVLPPYVYSDSLNFCENSGGGSDCRNPGM